MKPYQQIAIAECNEALVPIPLEIFAVESPHPYQLLGATYAEMSPYYLRQGVLDSLIKAQVYLQLKRIGWRIQIFDAYRPVAVQQFMVDYTFFQVAEAQKLDIPNLSPTEIQDIWQQVYQIWAVPSLDPLTPPPHSTGAAIDITLVDGVGKVINMGSPIDELSPRSHPDYFANSNLPEHQQYHRDRQLLREVMEYAGFARHPDEWWHFCQGDQMWAWLSSTPIEARYGRVKIY
ncbi:MAG: D-alanyl-D-alanine dipeptidase [Chroococcus sp. CMT-3BRIN-NPC107]|jgi:D-alanyl-D-alanine dipeptidase|nr:D-alanyl-D-alanine dipeptidase [Chroococcus sp. CMT-3BRIN-NPC107]